jgi:hypothetical protein
MKCRLQNRLERGIALVITLVMLAIVTVMAIVFLGVSRRERASVKLVEDIATANMMADAAGERAKAEAIAKMAAEGTKLYYDMFNSRSFENPNGFANQSATSLADPDNVSYRDKNGNPLDQARALRMLANMQYDPRVPVFVETNANRPKDFRYALDFDRNGLVETNGIVPVLDSTGKQISGKNAITGQSGPQFADLVGDPEWIGVLEKPDLPHSETNRFIGRLAYLVLPAGKTLDVNFLHNQVRQSSPDRLDINLTLPTGNGFSRNEGVGPWEINLGAFFRELNTNVWTRAMYNYVPGQEPKGETFTDARSFLAFRYPTRNFLRSANIELRVTTGDLNNQNIFNWDEIDNTGEGPVPQVGDFIFRPRSRAAIEKNEGIRPWPGSLNTNAFTDLQQMLTLGSPGLTNRLLGPLTRKSTEDRYQFYRLASQLGVDSAPAIKGKLHLNFVNSPGIVTNTAISWTSYKGANSYVPPITFFTNAADLMLKASIDGIVTVKSNRNDVLKWGREPGTYFLIGDTLVSTNFSLTNIQVYSPYKPAAGTNFPTLRQSEYSPAVHRILQLAVNIYDSMTNRGPALDATRGIYYPTVFRPVFTTTKTSGRTNIFISGWDEVLNVTEVFNSTAGIDDLASRVGVHSNITVFGQHLIVGAKKGHPNFNEMTLQTTAEVARKLEVQKGSLGAAPNTNAPNQMFMMALAQRWGLEAWNSYTNEYKRPIVIRAEVRTTAGIKDGTNLLQAPIQTWTHDFRPPLIQTNQWPGTTNAHNFIVPIATNYTLIGDLAYTKLQGFRNTNSARFTPLEPAPRFVLTTTNRVRYMVWDKSTGRILDYASFDNLVVTTDIGKVLYDPPSAGASHFGRQTGDNEDLYWDATPIGGTFMTRGISNQLAAATGDLPTSTAIWKAFRFSSAIQKDDDKNGAISHWRKFLGLPLSATNKPVGPVTELKGQIPFVPSRRIEQIVSWQVNDPLVHYMAQDIAPAPGFDLPVKKPVLDQSGNPASPVPSPWNIGALNDRAYRPWGGSPLQQAGGPTGDKLAFSVGVKDPGIRKSDDWDFPITERLDPKVEKKQHFFATIGELGRVHRGTPWQTVYLKSIYKVQNGTNAVLNGLDPTAWRNWSGSAGTHPMFDWRLLDVFTTAANENATRGLLSVNQTNRAAWSAVLSGIVVPTNTVEHGEALRLGPARSTDPATSYKAMSIEPATPHIAAIVDSISYARHHQVSILPNPNPAANPSASWVFMPQINPITQRTNNVFGHLGDVLGAPYLTVQSPYLNLSDEQVTSVMTDRAVEYIPERILSLLQRDEPRFVVYSFGQALKPAPRSLTSDPNYFHMCTNYQITGEVTTKTVFRVEGELPVKGNPLTENKPLHAVVESYEILPPVE